MPFTLLHPIRSKIYNQYQMIEFLISDFPYMQSLWHKKMTLSFRRESSEISEGDKEIMKSEFLQMASSYEGQRDYDGYFYNAMLVLVPNSQTDKIPKMSDFCAKKGIKLSSESMDSIEFIINKVRLLRNYITHSKWDRHDNISSEIATLKSLEEEYSDIYMDSSSIYLLGNTFLLKALIKERDVLLELSDKLGYTNRSTDNYTEK